ncbi:MAG: CatA-like O-acetyltransferase, partial [Pseudomonadota bacterium]
ITARVDVTSMMAARATGLSPFRACLFAIGAALHAVPALCMRMRGNRVIHHTRLRLSPTIALPNGDFGYAYLPWQPEFSAFDAAAEQEIARVRAGGALDPNDGSADDLAYLSCLPWLDFTALDNALPDAADTIPRVSWGKIVPTATGHDMAVALQVHHALADGAHVGQFFAELARVLDEVAQNRA